MTAYHQFRKLSKSVSIFRIAWTAKNFQYISGWILLQYYDACATNSDVLFLVKLLHNRPICVIASHHIMYSTKYPYGDLKDEKMLGKASQFISDSNSLRHVWRLYMPFWGKKGNTTIPTTCHKDPTYPHRSTVWHALQDCQLQPASLAEAKCRDITDRPPTGSPPLNLPTSRD